MTTLAELIADPWFPFEGDVRVKRLEERLLPEPDRAGLTADQCSACALPDDSYVWTDDRWRLRPYRDLAALAGIVLLETRAHHDSYADMPAELLADLGPLTARIERALLSLGDVARVHVCRWGDGSAHFHQWFFPRPLGARQLRGSMLPVWLDVLPPLPEADHDAVLERIATAMRSGD